MLTYITFLAVLAVVLRLLRQVHAASQIEQVIAVIVAAEPVDAAFGRWVWLAVFAALTVLMLLLQGLDKKRK